MRLSILVVDDVFVVYNKIWGAVRLHVCTYLSKMTSIKDVGEARWTLQMSI